MESRILIVRTDRIGDVILTTPMARLLKEERPQARIFWLASPRSAPVLELNPDLDEVLVDGGGPVGGLADRLRRQHFDAAIVALPRWRVAWAIRRAGIPLRIGPLSKPYSLLFSRPVRQHRSGGHKHEADYNLELLAALGIPFRRVPARLCLGAGENDQGARMVEALGVTPGRPLVILHPGSGGSAPRWPLRSFVELAGRLRGDGVPVMVTAGPGEDFGDSFQGLQGLVVVPPGRLELRQLAALLNQATLVVTNSTGPLHMAVALGVRTVSVYSSLIPCHPRRWGPYPSFAEGSREHAVLIAPQEDRDELRSVTVDAVLAACRERLEAAR